MLLGLFSIRRLIAITQTLEQFNNICHIRRPFLAAVFHLSHSKVRQTTHFCRLSIQKTCEAI
jgi:hypothetical protein